MLASAFAGIFASLAFFSFTEGKSVLLPKYLDISFSGLIFFFSALGTSCTGLFIQSDVFGPSFCKTTRRISFYLSVICFIYWVAALIFFINSFQWRYVWVAYVPVLLHFIYSKVDKGLGNAMDVEPKTELLSN